MTHALTTTATRVSLGPGMGGLGGWGAAALVVAVLGTVAWWASHGRRR